MNHFRVSPIFPFWNLEERHMILNVWVVIVWCHNEHTQRDPFYMRIAAHSTHPSPFRAQLLLCFPLKCIIAHDGARYRVLVLLYWNIIEVKTSYIRQTILIYKCFNHLHVHLHLTVKLATSKSTSFHRVPATKFRCKISKYHLKLRYSKDFALVYNSRSGFF